MLEAICRLATGAIIGIGSSNKYDHRNPFTAEETEKMIQAYLAPRFSNFKIIRIPDFGHLLERFQREFGEKTLKSIKNNVDYRKIETMEEERQHAAER